ncbi:MAG TPA: DUF4041 domain-containing protein [Pseudonocardiaceae bacterium]
MPDETIPPPAPAAPAAPHAGPTPETALGKSAPLTSEPVPARPARHAALEEPNDTVLVGPPATPPPPKQNARVYELEAEVDTLRQQLADADRRAREQQQSAGDDDLVELDDARLLQQVGIYHYHHPLENAELYRERLTELREQIKAMVKADKAIEASDRFSFNNSLAAGRKMTADFSKLMLRAYNAEADNCVRALRAGALTAATKRLETAAGTIARLGKMMEMRVSPDYHALRITELELTADYLFKQQEEREAAREERERLREERKAEIELAAQREKLDKERAHYLNTLAALRGHGAPAEVAELESRLAQIDAAIEENNFRAANIRAGYVYVISNIGAFGNRVVKIGMTRRLDPMDRIRELGDASVPFPFDVHVLHFSDDAVTLENELHNAFAARRLNHANPRREFFFATPEEVRDVLAEKLGNLLEYAAKPEAEQYYQSLSSWPDGISGEPAR